MTKYNYAFKAHGETIAKTVGRDITLSPKMAIEICKFIKGMETKKAIGILEKVQEKNLAVPITRAVNGAGHKRGMSSGKYPLKGSIEMIKLLKQLDANAAAKGMAANITVIHAAAQRAPEPFRQGRKGRVQFKRCHIELAAKETEKAKKVAPAKKETKVKSQ